jgi:hypothetical protein
VICGDALQWAVGGRERSSRQREPGDESDVAGFARLQNGFRAAHREVVHVLHRHDRNDLLRGFQLVDVDFGEPDVADLALPLQCSQLAELVFDRELRIDAMQLEQVDAFHAEAAQAHLTLLTQVRREAHRLPLVGPGAQQAGLRGDHEIVGIGVERLADEFL